MIKKLFTKDKIFIFICFFLLALIGFLFAIFYKNDINNMSNNSDIVLNDDNYYKSYHLDDNNNLVSDNLLNNDIIVFNSNETQIPLSSPIRLPAGRYTLSYSGVSFSSGAWQVLNGGTAFLTVNISQTSMSFTIYETIDFRFYANLNMNGAKFMLNSGSTALPYEPFGAIWYENHNINYYYFDNKVASVYYDSGSNDGQLLNTITLSQSSYSYYTLDLVDELESWLPNISRSNAFRVDIPMNISSDSLYINATWVTSDTDGYFYVYYDDGTRYLVPSTAYNSSLFVYDGGLINSQKNVLFISFRLVYDVIDSISFTTSPNVIYYNNGYNDGYNDVVDDYSGQITSLNNQLASSQNTINALNDRISSLEEQATSNLNGLFYNMISAVMSTPFNILHDYLNWDFFGINLFGLFTSLLSFLIVIWVIKFLIGRK